jgi:hypothetical protein
MTDTNTNPQTRVATILESGRKDEDATVATLILGGSWLLPAYSVYLAEILKPGKRYYYVGQTGDGKHLTARSPFHRLAAHLGYQRSSTENQIHKCVAERAMRDYPDLSERESVAKWWGDAQILFHHMRTEAVVGGVTGNDHQTKRRATLRLESALIQALLEIHERTTIWNKDVRPKRQRLLPGEKRLVDAMLAHLSPSQLT